MYSTAFYTVRKPSLINWMTSHTRVLSSACTVFDWAWDATAMSEACQLSDDNRTVNFHVNYSSGTAAIRGTQPMTDAQYFWEIKMNSPVYGTDMMVGLGSEGMKLDAFKHSFTSMLGRDGEGCGLSYYGRMQQKGIFRPVRK